MQVSQYDRRLKQHPTDYGICESHDGSQAQKVRSQSAKAHCERSISAVNRWEKTKPVVLKRIKEMNRIRIGEVVYEVLV